MIALIYCKSTKGNDKNQVDRKSQVVYDPSITIPRIILEREKHQQSCFKKIYFTILACIELRK